MTAPVYGQHTSKQLSRLCNCMYQLKSSRRNNGLVGYASELVLPMAGLDGHLAVPLEQER